MLTEKRLRFCQEYIVDCDATNAARRAGYSDKSANEVGPRLKNTPEVQKYINELLKGTAKKTGIDAAWVLFQLRDVYEKCMKQEPVKSWDYSQKKYIENGEFKFDSAGALRALELIGRHIGFFEIDNRQQPPININLTAIDIKYISDQLDEIV